MKQTAPKYPSKVQAARLAKLAHVMQISQHEALKMLLDLGEKHLDATLEGNMARMVRRALSGEVVPPMENGATGTEKKPPHHMKGKHYGKTKKCRFCHKMFGPQGIPPHEKKCASRAGLRYTPRS
jgi:hypothetical protein